MKAYFDTSFCDDKFAINCQIGYLIQLLSVTTQHRHSLGGVREAKV